MGWYAAAIGLIIALGAWCFFRVRAEYVREATLSRLTAPASRHGADTNSRPPFAYLGCSLTASTSSREPPCPCVETEQLRDAAHGRGA